VVAFTGGRLQTFGNLARIGAVVAMRVEDYYPEGKRWWLRLHEKGGKRHEMPAQALSRELDSGCANPRVRGHVHAAVVTARHSRIASARKRRSVRREIR
jgi:hypothetical protein